MVRQAAQRLLSWQQSHVWVRSWQALLLGYALLLLTLSLIPLSGGIPGGNDKLAHLLGYAALAGLLRLAWPQRGHGLLWLLAFLYGVMIECLQSLLPWRGFEWLDMVANGVGAALGLALAAAGLELIKRLGSHPGS